MISTPLFENEQIILTELDFEKDLERDAGFTQDMRYARYWSKGFIKPLSKNEMKSKYEKLEKEMDDHKSQFHFALREKSSQMLIGYLRLYWVVWNHAVGSMSIAIGDPQSIGKVEGGILDLGLQYAFQELNLYRVDFHVSQFESDLLRALEEKHWFKEVTFREGEFFGGKYWDRYVYGITIDQWKNGELR